MAPKTRGRGAKRKVSTRRRGIVEEEHSPPPPFVAEDPVQPPVIVPEEPLPTPPVVAEDPPPGVVEMPSPPRVDTIVESPIPIVPNPVVEEGEIRDGSGESEKEGESGSEESENQGEEEIEEGEKGGEEESEEGEKGEEEEATNSGSSRTVTQSMEHDAEVESVAIPPMGMYFPPSEYKKKIKISTRCFIDDCLQTLKNLKPPLNDKERGWFEKHPQFRHIFHMPRVNNHKVMGMWMLLLRTVQIEREKEAWFAVNGVPIRYGLREHALISGLNCQNYPVNFMEMGGLKLVNKYFGDGATIRYQDVKVMLEEMEPSMDRLKMAVLYLLSSIIIGQTKMGKDASPVEPFFLRAVDDLKLCKTFPWGRLSFDNMLKEISHTMDHFGGEVKEGVLWPIPGFCLPLELLAFEAIPELFVKFREPLLGADETCPRMCKSTFKKSENKGFPLSRINEVLGRTKDIESILVAYGHEDVILHKMMEQDDDDDKHDVVVESWMRRFKEGYHVCFEQMFEDDVAARVTVEEEPEAPALAGLAAVASETPRLEAGTSETPGTTETPGTSETQLATQLKELVILFHTMQVNVGERLQRLEATMVSCEERLQVIEGSMDKGRGKGKKRGRND